MTQRERFTIALQGAFDRLRVAHAQNERGLRDALRASTGLSSPMIAWALEHSLPRDLNLPSAAQTSAPAPAHVDRTLAVVLAGNVFTACIRALAWPLLLGWHVRAKADGDDDVLPRAFCEALRMADPDVGARLSVQTFHRTDEDALRALLRGSDAVAVYGSDATVAAIDGLREPSTRLIAHGHGVSAAFVGRGAIRGRTQRMLWSQRLAIDVAAYDQRGCLSPHLVLVDADDPGRAHKLAVQLHEALHALERTLPRGPVPDDVAIRQSQWRSAMAAMGELFEGPTHAVALVEPSSDPTTMIGPGHRHVLVVPYTSEPSALSSLRPWGHQLKSLGVAPDGETLTRIRTLLAPELRPTVVAAGTMQAPAFDAWADGEPPWFGLVD